MDNTSLLTAARRRWWIIVLLALVGAVFGALPEPARVEEQVVTRYSATHTMLQNADVLGTQSALINASQIQLFATTGEVPTRAAEELDYSGSPALLASQVEVNFDFNTGALTVTTVQDSAQWAERVADVYAEVLNAYLVERQDVLYQNRLAALLTRLEELERELNRLTDKLAVNPGDPVIEAQRGAVARQYGVAFEQSETLSSSPNILSFSTLQRAQAVPETEGGGISAPTSRLTRAVMGGILGAALGMAVALLLGVLDRRLRTREQVESLLGMRARVLIHRTRSERAGGIVVSSGRHDPLSDAYRTTRNVVGFIYNGLEPVDRARITVVVSPGPGDGKTSMAANLAAAFAEMGQRTVVVNTDFRRPRLSHLINGAAVSPSAFHLGDLETIDPSWLLRETPLQNLMLLDLAGMGSAGELAAATARLLPRLARQFDAVVVDTSPVAATAEVLEIVPVADLIVLVSRLGHTRIEAAERAVSILHDTTAAPIVLALTGAHRERAGYYEYSDRRSKQPEGAKVRTGWFGRGKRSRYDGPERRRTERKLGELQVSSGARRRRYMPGEHERSSTELRLFDAVSSATRADGNGQGSAHEPSDDVRGPSTGEQVASKREP
jgi:Mrp family chromosome partitioning ATPase/capsular polysaccharide biosynthesis protein